jgi:hypothetical protein
MTAGVEIAWSAAFLKEKWLVESMYVDSYKVWTFEPSYD